MADKKVVLMEKFSPVPYAQELIDRYDENIFYTGKGPGKSDRLYVYDENEGIWIDGEDILKKILRRDLFGLESQKTHYVNEILNYIKDITYNPEREAEPKPRYIPCANGVWDIEKRELLDYAPRLFFTYKLPWRVLPGQKHECPTIEKLFKEWGAEEKDVKALWELAAYCLYRGYPYQKFFVILGPGGNGKDQYFRILERTLGEENCASVDFFDLTSNDTWASALLYRKLVNFAGEVNSKTLQDTNLIKKLTGGSMITAHFKYKPHFQFRNYAKIICSSNDLPESPDKTIAWYSRFYPIFLPNVFRGTDKEVKNIADKIPDDEIEAFFNKLLLEVLPELMERDWSFTWDPSTEELEELYEDLSNPLHRFVETFFERDPEGAVPKFAFKELYNNWCKQYGYNPKNDKEIKIYMVDKRGLDDEKVSYSYEEARYWWYLAYRSELKGEDSKDEDPKPKRFNSWKGIRLKESVLKNVQGVKGVKGVSETPIYRGQSSADTLDMFDTLDTTGTDDAVQGTQNSEDTLDMCKDSHNQNERLKAILSTIRIQQKLYGNVSIEELKSGLGSYFRTFLEEDLEYLKQQGKIFEPKPGHYRLVED